MTDTEQLCERRYLLVKRGLYYAPDNQGYTGLKDKAGRYALSEKMDRDDITAVHEDEAGEFAPACWQETKIAHLKSLIQSLTIERDAAVAQATRMRVALEAIRAGDVPRPVAGRWRKDGVPCKHDNCEHNRFMWEDCPNCIDDHIGVALSEGVE